MSLPLVVACLLLLPFPSVVDGDRSAHREMADLQLERERQARKPPRHLVRTPRMEEGKLIKVIDVSDDDDQEPDTEGEYTGASLTKPGMPPDFTVCGAFRTEDSSASPSFFTWKADDGATYSKWGYIYMNALATGTVYEIVFGNVKQFVTVKLEKVFFPFDWVRFCASLNTLSENLVLVVDGTLQLEERLLIKEDDYQPRPTDLKMTVGYAIEEGGYANEFTGQYSNLNIFSEALPTEKMEAMTQAGSPECGAPGDYLSWEEADWQLHSRAKIAMLEEGDGPCKKASLLHIYTGEFIYHSDCMEHCQKLGKGRSPPIRTGQELETLRAEMRAITEDTEKLPNVWLSLTYQEEVYRDYYSRNRVDNYTKPWNKGSCMKHLKILKTLNLLVVSLVP